MNVEVTGRSRQGVDPRDVGSFVSSVLQREALDHDSRLSVFFVDRKAMAALNADHMGRTGPTDVLSFPIEDAAPHKPPARIEGGPPLELGDIFICADIVEAHAEQYGVTFTEELHLMVVHGVLHILGWDHQTGSEAEAMEFREAEHLATIGMTRR